MVQIHAPPNTGTRVSNTKPLPASTAAKSTTGAGAKTRTMNKHPGLAGRDAGHPRFGGASAT